MSIGVSIFLMAVGAILAFAVRDSMSDVDLTAVGYILMAAGLVGVVITLIMQNQRSNTRHTVVEDREIREVRDNRTL